VERTEDVVKVGDHLRVMVLQADKVRRRISLSLKQLEPRPAGAVVHEYDEGMAEHAYAEAGAEPQRL
jgi:ribosomal protein S1